MVRTAAMIAGASLAIFLAGAIALADPGHPPVAAPEVHYTAQPIAIPIALFRDQRIVFDGTIDGRPTPMMLDSGAGRTVVDRAFAEQIGLKGSQAIRVQGAGGQVPGEIATDVSIAVGSLRLDHISVLILDMVPIARSIGRPIPVLLGRDAFKAGVVTIDFPGRHILFSSRDSFRPPAGAARLDMTERGLLAEVTVGVAGQAPIEAVLDPGNSGALVLAHSYWTAQPQLAGLHHAASEIGGVGGFRPVRRVTLPDVEFGGRRFERVPAILNEDPAALPTSGANVGIEMLKPFVATFDWNGHALYLEGAQQTPPFEHERIGARFELDGDRLKIAYVSPDGPAASAGLKPGDAILAVDGVAVDTHYYDRPDWARRPAGTAVRLAKADGRTVTVTLADYY